jgi:predicted RNase H-like nuclease
MKFLGIDLGWVSGATGLCCLEWRSDRLHLVALECRLPLPEILAWVDQQVPPGSPGMVAIDAPTQITNQTGMRGCDRKAHHYFGRYHAGCYPANLNSAFAARTTGFSQALAARGFAHAPAMTPQQPGRYQIEVYPHAAMIGLFALPQILKYKKGKIADRRTELERLRHLILTYLPQQEPPLVIKQLPAIPAQGTALKIIEDQLDSLICAYVGAHWWYWGHQRNLVLADLSLAEIRAASDLNTTITSGYIVIPYPQGNPELLD